jgi:hypothetical protein
MAQNGDFRTIFSEVFHIEFCEDLYNVDKSSQTHRRTHMASIQAVLVHFDIIKNTYTYLRKYVFVIENTGLIYRLLISITYVAETEKQSARWEEGTEESYEYFHYG